jgi:hypothetical protein
MLVPPPTRTRVSCRYGADFDERMLLSEAVQDGAEEFGLLMSEAVEVGGASAPHRSLRPTHGTPMASPANTHKTRPLSLLQKMAMRDSAQLSTTSPSTLSAGGVATEAAQQTTKIPTWTLTGTFNSSASSDALGLLGKGDDEYDWDDLPANSGSCAGNGSPSLNSSRNLSLLQKMALQGPVPRPDAVALATTPIFGAKVSSTTLDYAQPSPSPSPRSARFTILHTTAPLGSSGAAASVGTPRGYHAHQAHLAPGSAHPLTPEKHLGTFGNERAAGGEGDLVVVAAGLGMSGHVLHATSPRTKLQQQELVLARRRQRANRRLRKAVALKLSASGKLVLPNALRLGGLSH